MNGPDLIYNIYGEIIGGKDAPKILAEIKAKEEEAEGVLQDQNKKEDEEEKEKTVYKCLINVAQTNYSIVRRVAKKYMEWVLKRYHEDHEGAIRKGEHGLKLSPLYDLTWHDTAITADFFAKL